MSSETQPINPARFAEALKELPASSLAFKVLELRNSIAHLDYSNAELKPFAEGLAPTHGSSQTNAPDQDCIDAIAENEAVIARMMARIDLIKTEVENRGLSWAEFQGKDDTREAETATSNGDSAGAAATAGGAPTNGVNGHAAGSGEGQQHPAWTDGTFQMGTLRAGLSDEELLRQLQERIPELRDPGDEQAGDDDDEGMHL